MGVLQKDSDLYQKLEEEKQLEPLNWNPETALRVAKRYLNDCCKFTSTGLLAVEKHNEKFKLKFETHAEAEAAAETLRTKQKHEAKAHADDHDGVYVQLLVALSDLEPWSQGADKVAIARAAWKETRKAKLDQIKAVMPGKKITIKLAKTVHWDACKDGEDVPLAQITCPWNAVEKVKLKVNAIEGFW